MEETHMSKLAGIELTTENVETFFIPVRQIKSLYINGLESTLDLNSDGDLEKITRCQAIVLGLDYRQVNRQETFAMSYRDKFLHLGDRLQQHADLSVITLCYENGQERDIRVPWNFWSDYRNYNMMVHIDKEFNKETVIVAENQEFLKNKQFWMEA